MKLALSGSGNKAAVETEENVDADGNITTSIILAYV
jgi:hypothetical protein